MARPDSRRLQRRSLLLLGMLLALGSCARTEPPPRQPPPVPAEPAPPPAPEPARAVDAGVRAGPRLDTFGITPVAAAQALAAFRTSCPDLTRREDVSGLVRPADW